MFWFGFLPGGFGLTDGFGNRGLAAFIGCFPGCSLVSEDVDVGRGLTSMTGRDLESLVRLGDFAVKVSKSFDRLFSIDWNSALLVDDSGC